MYWRTSRLRVVPHEFLFRTYPIFDVVSVLPATCLIQTEGELCDLVVCRVEATASVLSHRSLTRDVCDDCVSYLLHDSLIFSVFLSVLLTRPRRFRRTE